VVRSALKATMNQNKNVMSAKIQRYVVEGFGRFPLDMLRYDMAWPDAPEDTGKIESPSIERTRVTLSRTAHFHPKPDEGRWHSFGWKIIEVRKS
jgi:hypothetical protein